jgi:general secretion pathway protein M
MKRFTLNRIHIFQALTLLALLLPAIGGAYIVWGKHQHVQSLIADLEPRYARLQGLLDRRADLQALEAKASEQLVRLSYPKTQDVAKSGNDAQQRIRSLFAENHLEIISIQVLPAKETGKFDRISINLRVEGDLSGIQTALGRLTGLSPIVVLDNLALQTIGAVRPASIQRLSGQFTFSVFRVRG